MHWWKYYAAISLEHSQLLICGMEYSIGLWNIYKTVGTLQLLVNRSPRGLGKRLSGPGFGDRPFRVYCRHTCRWSTSKLFSDQANEIRRWFLSAYWIAECTFYAEWAKPHFVFGYQQTSPPEPGQSSRDGECRPLRWNRPSIAAVPPIARGSRRLTMNILGNTIDERLSVFRLLLLIYLLCYVI